MRKDGLSMSSVYNATNYMDSENAMRNIVGTVTAATLKLKSYGFSDEAVYEIIPIVMGVEIKADQRKIDQIEEILECVHDLADTEEEFAQKVRDILSGKG